MGSTNVGTVYNFKPGEIKQDLLDRIRYLVQGMNTKTVETLKLSAVGGSQYENAKRMWHAFGCYGANAAGK